MAAHAAASPCAPNNQTCPFAMHVLGRDGRVVRRRPAFRRSVLGAGAQREDRSIDGQTELGDQRRGADGIGGELRFDVLCGRVRCVGERDESIDEARQLLRVERADIVQHAVTPFAAPAGAPRNAREERHQRGFETVRQHDRAIVADPAQRAPDVASYPPAEFAVPNRQRHDVGNAGHATAQRRGRRRRQDMNFDVVSCGQQCSNQRVRDHHVADPGRTHDQELHRRFMASAFGPARHRRRRACATPDARCVCRGPDRSTAPAASR